MTQDEKMYELYKLLVESRKNHVEAKPVNIPDIAEPVPVDYIAEAKKDVPRARSMAEEIIKALSDYQKSTEKGE